MWFRSRSFGKSDLKFLEVPVQSFKGFGPEFLMVLVQNFQRSRSKSSEGSEPEVPEVLVLSLGSSCLEVLEVLEVLVLKFQWFRYGNSEGSNPEVLDVPVQKF
jgi:hypothetical protein